MATSLASPHPFPAHHQDPTKPLLELLRYLKSSDYVFITPTPATHARVIVRFPEARSLRDVLGWSLPFRESTIDGKVVALLRDAGALEGDRNGLLRAKLRISSLGDELFLHSAYPTDEEDAVFLGPDSYRFAEIIRQELARCPDRKPARIADIGTGAGVGAIVAAKCCPGARVSMTDINPRALQLARVNAQAASVVAEIALGRGLQAVAGNFDLIFANPPYIVDDAGRGYRDGGCMRGGQVAVEMTSEAAGRLAPGGKFILYSGSAIVEGTDLLRDALQTVANERNCSFQYRELDPDVFGEELDGPAYRDVERIAIVAAVLTDQR